tara:strand:- start:2170 stop:2619 length:450 start_codon:yes stop_codon:yes gene_type:complete
MIHLKSDTVNQIIYITGHEEYKRRDPLLVPLQIIFEFTDELTKEKFRTGIPLIRPKGFDPILGERYWIIPQISTLITSDVYNGGIRFTNGGYFSYICWVSSSESIIVEPDFSDTSKFCFIERGLALIGEEQDYYNEFDQDVPSTIAYNG